jgi:hypothetical protein
VCCIIYLTIICSLDFEEGGHLTHEDYAAAGTGGLMMHDLWCGSAGGGGCRYCSEPCGVRSARYVWVFCSCVEKLQAEF